MTILHDTREQQTDRARRRYAAFGVPTEAAVLDYGDYTYQAQLPDGRLVYDTSGRIEPICAVERKMNLDELAACFTRERKRFEAEMIRCKDHGGLLLGRYRSKFAPEAYLASIVAWTIRYDLQVIFCTQDSSPRLIREILYRDLKERLERGEDVWRRTTETLS